MDLDLKNLKRPLDLRCIWPPLPNHELPPPPPPPRDPPKHIRIPKKRKPEENVQQPSPPERPPTPTPPKKKTRIIKGSRPIPAKRGNPNKQREEIQYTCTMEEDKKLRNDLTIRVRKSGGKRIVIYKPRFPARKSPLLPTPTTPSTSKSLLRQIKEGK